MILVIAIPSLNDKDRKALAGIQHHKKLAYPTASGSFRTAPVDFVYVTTPHNNQELIDKVLALHQQVEVGYCSICRTDTPCETVRILTGEDE
jgi:hypothetical protein